MPRCGGFAQGRRVRGAVGIGEVGDLRPLYATLGAVLRERFRGWRAGVITSEPGLAQATGLPFKPPGPPVLHGGLRVQLWQTGVLK